MAFTALTAAQTDADSPLDQTLFDTIRTNFDDHEARVGSLTAISYQDIRDDFATNSATWSSTFGGGELWVSDEDTLGARITHNSDGHYAQFAATNNGTHWGWMRSIAQRMRFKLNTAHTVVFEARFKNNTNPDANMVLGFQDTGLAAANVISDRSDYIGIVIGTATKTIRFRASLGGSAIESADLGNTDNWQTVKITVTSSTSGTTRTVAGELDGSPVSWAATTSNIPNSVQLAPTCGILGDGTDRRFRVDYILAYWQTRPLSEA